MNGVSAHDVVQYDGYPAWWVWWLEHGLDGIAGGIIGGVIAVLGVMATLAYDRRARRQERADQNQAEAESVVRGILEKAIDAEGQLETFGPWRDAETKLKALNREVKLAEPVLHRVPELGRPLLMLGVMADRLADKGSSARQEAGQVAFSIVRRCTNWLRSPQSYSSGSVDRAEVMAYGDTLINKFLTGVVEDHRD